LSILLALLALAAVGCGGEDEPVAPAQPASTSTPAATATATETASPAATETPAATASPTATATSPEDQEGGAGDEEAARVPVEFTVGADGITPPQVSVPAFLALELVVRNEHSAPVTVRLAGAEPFEVRAGETHRERLDGRRPGRYPLDAEPFGSATLITGVEAGP
jgi:hypothetical protein